MKKGLMILFAVAILGSLGLYVSRQPAGSPLGSSNNSATLSARTNQTPVSSGRNTTSGYKDGTFQGSASDTPYGTVKVAVVISGGKISDVDFLQMPNDQGHSREVTAYAEPLLKQSTINAQSSSIQFVSGATDTSFGYEESLQKALDQAVNA